MGGSFLGALYAMRLKKRVTELKELEKILIYIQSEIRYHHAILYEAFLLAGKRFKRSAYRDWLNFIGNRASPESCDSCPVEINFTDIWEISLEMLSVDFALSREDVRGMEALGQAYGCLDIENQNRAIDIYLEELHRTIIILDKALPSKMKNSFTFGLLGGVLMVLILL